MGYKSPPLGECREGVKKNKRDGTRLFYEVDAVAECLRDAAQYVDGGGVLAALYPGEVALADVAARGQLRLCHSLAVYAQLIGPLHRLAQFGYPLPDALPFLFVLDHGLKNT